MSQLYISKITIGIYFVSIPSLLIVYMYLQYHIPIVNMDVLFISVQVEITILKGELILKEVEASHVVQFMVKFGAENT